jgi:PAS domain S-box-containing protein
MRLAGCALVLLLAVGVCAQASPLLGQAWHERAAQIRALEENDARQAYSSARQLLAELPADAPAVKRVQALNLLARAELYLAETDQAARHAEAALALARQNDDRVGRAEADLVITLNTVNQGRIEAMNEAVRDAMETLEGMDQPRLRAEAMLRVSMMYLRLKQFELAVTVAMQAMDIAKRSQDPLVRAYAEQGLAMVFDQTGRIEEAHSHFRNLLEAAQAAHSSLIEADALLGLSHVDQDTGDLFLAEQHLSQAIAIYRRAGVPFYVGHALYMLAEVYWEQRQPAKALPLLDEVATLYEGRDNPIGLWWTLNKRSRVQQALGRLAEAQADAEQGNELAKRIGMPVYLAGSAQQLASIAALRGDYKRAYALSTKAAELTAQSEHGKTADRIRELAQQYQTESKQRQIDELTRRNAEQAQQQRWLWTVLGGGTILLVVTAYFLFHLRRSRNEIRALNTGLEQRVEERTAELEQSRKSLAEAQRIAHIGSWRLDLSTHVLTWSDEIYCIFEIDTRQSNITYDSFLKSIHPDDRQSVDLAYKTSLESRTPYETEHRLLLPGGRIKYVHERCETTYDQAGKALYSLGTVQDVTERKRAELALKQALEFTEGIIHAVPDPLFEMDRDGRYLNIWAKHQEPLAAQREALLGKSIPEALAAEAAEISMAAIAEADETGQSFGKTIRLDLPQGERWFELSVAKKADGGGVDDRFIVLSRDITERKRLEQQLAERERQYRSLVENLPDSIARYDCEGRLRYVNPELAKRLGTVSDKIGLGVRERYPDGSFEAYARTLDEVIATSADRDVEIDLPKPGSGSNQFSHVRMVAERGENGELLGVLAIGRDISARKRYEDAREAALAEAERLAKLRSEFIAHMSHELRTPLNGILGYAQMLQRDKAMSERNAAALNVIREGGEHLLALIEDILDLARIESGRLELDIGEMPLPRFLNVVADIVAVKASQKGLEFVRELASDLPELVRGDERRLRQVLLNLLANAIKFTDHGRVVLRVDRIAPTRFVFMVRDSGIGIGENERETIFQAFEQVGDAQHRHGGSGLGLAISRQLVRLMGGDIVVESRVGEGSVFRFELNLPETGSPAVVVRATAAMDGRAEPDDEPAGPLLAPPVEAMRELHRLARLGNMRDILRHAEYISGLAPDYHPFADHLRRLAEAYQSKAILAFVEHTLHDLQP